MIQAWVLSALRAILQSPETKLALFKAIDRAVPDNKNPIDQKAADVVKAVYDVVVKSL